MDAAIELAAVAAGLLAAPAHDVGRERLGADGAHWGGGGFGGRAGASGGGCGGLGLVFAAIELAAVEVCVVLALGDDAGRQRLAAGGAYRGGGGRGAGRARLGRRGGGGLRGCDRGNRGNRGSRAGGRPAQGGHEGGQFQRVLRAVLAFDFFGSFAHGVGAAQFEWVDGIQKAHGLNEAIEPGPQLIGLDDAGGVKGFCCRGAGGWFGGETARGAACVWRRRGGL